MVTETGTTPEHEIRRKRQLSASEDYFDFFPPPPTVATPELDSEQNPTEPSPTRPTEMADLVPVSLSI